MATSGQLQELLKEYWNQILKSMGIPEGSAPPPIQIVPAGTLDTKGQDTYAAWDREAGYIKVEKDYLSSHDASDFAGMLVHEGTHAAMFINGAQGKNAEKWIEPLANAVRYKLTGNRGGWVPDEQTQRLAQLQPLEFKYITAALGGGAFSPSLLKKVEEGTVTHDQIRDVLGKIDESGGSVDPSGGYSHQQYPSTDGFGTDTAGGGGDGGGIDRGGAPGGPGSDDKDEAEARRRARLKQNRQQRASVYETLNGYGIALTAETQALANQAAQHDWTQSQFMQKLRETAAYRQRFPGIFANDGTTKMSEAEYIQSEKLYGAYASTAGLGMGPKRMAFLFRNNVTPSEFQDRAEADARIARSPELMKAFKRELVQSGTAKASEVSNDKELFKFVMGEGNKAWADLWQDTVTRNAAVQAGIQIAKNRDRYTAISQKAIEHISSLGISEAEMAQKFVNLSDILGQVLPLQEADLYGVKKKTAVSAVFGGKNSERARQRIQRAIDTDEAFYEQRAGNATYSDEQGGLVVQGVTDRSKQQQSEY